MGRWRYLRGLAVLIDAADGKDILGEIDADEDNGHGLPLFERVDEISQPHSLPFAARRQLGTGKSLSFARRHEAMGWIKLLEILWAWPTVILIVLAFFHREIRTLLQRVAATSRAKFGSLELEMAPPIGASGNKPLERIEGKRFTSGVVDLDGKEFFRCDFDTVTLRFSGKNPVGLSHCSFGNVRWEFADSAALTMQFLGGLYSGAGEGGRKLVETTFENVRRGALRSDA